MLAANGRMVGGVAVPSRISESTVKSIEQSIAKSEAEYDSSGASAAGEYDAMGPTRRNFSSLERRKKASSRTKVLVIGVGKGGDTIAERLITRNKLETDAGRLHGWRVARNTYVKKIAGRSLSQTKKIGRVRLETSWGEVETNHRQPS
jgi:hypothetical protein